MSEEGDMAFIPMLGCKECMRIGCLTRCTTPWQMFQHIQKEHDKCKVTSQSAPGLRARVEKVAHESIKILGDRDREHQHGHHRLLVTTIAGSAGSERRQSTEEIGGGRGPAAFLPDELNGPLANEWKVPYKIREPQPGEEEDREEETHGVKTLTAHQQRVLREYVQMDLPIPSEDEREILARKVKKEKREEGDREPPPPPPAPLAAARTLSEAVMRTGDARLAERNSLGPLGRHWRKK